MENFKAYSDAFYYHSPNSFFVSGNKTDIFVLGVRVQFSQYDGNTEIIKTGEVLSSEYTGGRTIVTIQLNNTTIENGSISEPFYTYDLSIYQLTGPQGPKGDRGDNGVGIPSGGSQGQVLTKSSTNDYDTQWQTIQTNTVINDIQDNNTTQSPSSEAVYEALQLKSDTMHTHTTTNVSEGTNLYYTDARADARIAAQKAQANGLATLDANGKLLDSQVSAIAITDTFVVNTQSAMLALTAEIGDVAVRTDLNKSFILRVAGASVLANWQELLTPTDAVASVNGKTGVVTVTKTDVGLANVDNTSDATKNSATVALTNKQINLSTSFSNLSSTGIYVSLNYGESITQGDLVYLKNDGSVYKADANDVGTYPSMGIALVTAASGVNRVLLHGTYRNDTRFNWTPGGILYLSTTAGELTQTQPTGVDEVVQIVGFALTADIVYINPSLDYMTHA